jgi:hypothetical protein
MVPRHWNFGPDSAFVHGYSALRCRGGIKFGTFLSGLGRPYKMWSNKVASATQRRGWEITSVNKEQKPDREKNRTLRARQRAIGRELRRMYDDVAREPVPDELLDLLHKIDDPGHTGGGGASS